MLKEKVTYPDGLPINISVMAIEEYPIHFHDELEVIFVLDGTVKVKDGYYTYSLKKDDVLIINDRELHSINRTREPNIILIYQIDLQFFSQFHSNLSNPFFVTDTSYHVEGLNEPLEKLRKLMAITMLEVINKAAGYKDRIIDSANAFITGLNNDFQYFSMDEGKFVNEMKNKGNKILAERVHRITDFIYENYDRKLTLQEIADREHLSIYYLSHVIKESMGLSFQDFLNFVRVEQSEKLLLGTNRKTSEISFECGFSASRYYIKYFEKWYGCHPDEYRQIYSKKIIGNELNANVSHYVPESILSILKNRFNNEYSNYGNNNGSSIKSIEINCMKEGKNYRAKHFIDTFLIQDSTQYLYAENLKRLKEVCNDLKIKNVKVSLNSFVEPIALKNIMDMDYKVKLSFDYPQNQQAFDDIIFKLRMIIRKDPQIFQKLFFELVISESDKEKAKTTISQIKEVMGTPFNIKVQEYQQESEINYLNDSILKVPFILKNILESCKEQKNLDLCGDTNTHAFLSGEPGIITRWGIKKPSYFAYQMLAELEGEEIAKDKGYIIIKNEDTIKILLYASEVTPKDYKELKSPDELLSIIENTRTDNQWVLKLKELKGHYKIKRYKLNKSNCIFTLYSNLGFPETLTLKEEQMITWASYPGVSIKETIVDNGVLDIHSNMDEFSAELIIVEKI